jgi:hypothetical protein
VGFVGSQDGDEPHDDLLLVGCGDCGGRPGDGGVIAWSRGWPCRRGGSSVDSSRWLPVVPTWRLLIVGPFLSTAKKAMAWP